jgi:phage terminase small subunit
MSGTVTPAKGRKRAGKPPRRQSSDKLTAKQEAFVQEYIKDMNAAGAARRAGYSGASLDSVGSQVLSNPKIQARIAVHQAARLARTQVDSDFVLKRLLDEINADAGDLYDDDGRLLPVKQWPEVWRRGMVSMIRTKVIYGRGDDRATPIGEATDVVLVDRARRLELLGRHIKVNAFAPDKVQLGLDSPLQELFRQIAGNVIRPASEKAKQIEHDATPRLQDRRGAGSEDT